MRFHLLASLVIAAAFAGCSSAQLQRGNPALPSSPSKSVPAAIGPTPAPIATASWEDSIFVVDTGVPAVKLFARGTWAANGSFTNGVASPYGIWSDQKYLYVPNSINNGANVEEYRPDDTTPIFTYTNGLSGNAINVSTQDLGGVHYVFVVVGSTGFGNGYVRQFRRDTNTVIATCTPNGQGQFGVAGVAVDPNGNVFVSYYGSDSSTHIVEYVGGLGGCAQTPLITLPTEGADMVLDHAGRLVLCDGVSTCDIINPPYTSISGTLGSGFDAPFYVTINATNQLAYVTDGLGVHVLSYPSGAPLHTIGASAGLHNPVGVVDWFNYGF